MEVHRIGLSRAWDRLAGGDRRAAWIRRFGRPGTIDPGERVFLVVEAVGRPLEIRFNGGDPVPVAGGVDRLALDITERLRGRNEVVVACDSAPADEPGASRVPLPESIARFAIEITTVS